jgi:hypothetical protein
MAATAQRPSENAAQAIVPRHFMGLVYGEDLAAQNCGSVEIEIADGFFDGLVFGLLQAFGEFAFEDIVFRALGFNRKAKFLFYARRLVAKQFCGVVEIYGRSALGWRFVRQDGADLPVYCQFRVTARAFHFKRCGRLLRHAAILRQFQQAQKRNGGCAGLRSRG